MSKVSLIIKREYITRVRKRSFIIMSVIGPLIMAALFIVPVYVSQLEVGNKLVGIVDETGLFEGKFINTENLHFTELHQPIDEAKKNLDNSSMYAIVYIPETKVNIPQDAIIYSLSQPNVSFKGYVKNILKKEVESLKLKASGIDPDLITSIRKTNINLMSVKIGKEGEEKTTHTELTMMVGLVGSIIIYFFIFMFGSLLMRGVIEEKTSRIIEVIVSSVKPFQLMLGKIIGVALVGITQFALWIIFTVLFISIFFGYFSSDISAYNSQKMQLPNTEIIGTQSIPQNLSGEQVNESVIAVMESIQSINFPLVIISFFIFFLGGYLLYGALFTAIGAAVDHETDTQQFMMPLTIPLILSVVLSQFIINNPSGPLAVWLSMIPFTSPVIMMIRIPFGVPVIELIFSIAFLIAGFIFTTWLASKIYRTGILMYGQKINYQVLWKWVRQKN